MWQWEAVTTVPATAYGHTEISVYITCRKRMVKEVVFRVDAIATNLASGFLEVPSQLLRAPPMHMRSETYVISCNSTFIRPSIQGRQCGSHADSPLMKEDSLEARGVVRRRNQCSESGYDPVGTVKVLTINKTLSNTIVPPREGKRSAFEPVVAGTYRKRQMRDWYQEMHLAVPPSKEPLTWDGDVGPCLRRTASPVSVPIAKKRIGLRREWTERAADEGFMWRDGSFADKQVLLQKLLLSGARCGGFIDQLYCCEDITQSLEGFCGVTGVAFFLGTPRYWRLL
ncbi:hypothetical protein BKA82DRAFT_4015691 [Pisolithus tinctorius]|nr:hypothetical protein BKA82DRAFT_4015691 [Pisolithus tinctorius]